MEEEKKRKREADHGGGGGGGGGGGERRRRKEVAVVAAAAAATSQPSEEEVEEFFTILRRMHVAVKYFEKNGISNISAVNGEGRKTTELSEDGVDGVKFGGRRDVMVVGNGGLDLNTVPEAEI